MESAGLPMILLAVRGPPPLPSSVTTPPSPPKVATRLYTQGVQAAVQPQAGDAEDAAGGPFGEVSTQSLNSYIDKNLSEMHGAEPSALTIADPEMINLAEELTIGPFSRVRLKAFGRWAIAPLLCSALSVAACWYLWGRRVNEGGSMPTVAVVAPATAAPAPAPVAAPAPPPIAAPAAAPAPAPKPVAVAPAPAPKPVAAASSYLRCRARITSRPSGAEVMLGDRRLGTTPLETGELPCAGTSFTLVRPRYSPATATFPANAAGPTELAVKLSRPEAELTLTSTPANAQFRVNRTIVGPGTRSVPVQRFEKVHIEATLPGHRKWQKTVYVTAANTAINATLSPGR
jgi:hypothetical protein